MEETVVEMVETEPVPEEVIPEPEESKADEPETEDIAAAEPEELVAEPSMIAPRICLIV